MADAHDLSRGRRFLVGGLIFGATILAILAIFAVFANRQLFNADNWADTSGAMLESPEIREQLSTFLVEELYSNVDVAGEVSAALPPRLQPLAGPIAGGFRNVVERGANRLLERPRVQGVWETANRATAQQFINIAEDKSRAITTSGDAVVLDLRVVLLDMVQRVGLPGTLAGKIPESAGKIRVMSAEQVNNVQTLTKLLKNLAWVLPFLSLGMLALAVILAPGRRRTMLIRAGAALIAAGAAVLVIRSLVGHAIVESLASSESTEPAAQAVWDIGSGILRDVAQATIIGGIPLVLAGLLAGPTRAATTLRRHMAPYLSERVGATYGVVAVALLIVLAWQPVPATGKLIPVLIMIGLTILGVEALRRQTAEEFPDATLEDAHAERPEHA